MADPPRRITQNGQPLVLIDPMDPKLTEQKRQELSLEEFKAMEDSIFQEAADVVHSAVSFGDIEPGQEEVPEEWIRQYGYPRAKKRHRLAKAAWLPQSEAPVGLKMAAAVMLGTMRVRAADNGQRLTNHGTVILVQAPQNYEVKELEE